jgi:hypothetical protein
MLEAYVNPCSVEELSILLGVAAPYLEEELDELVTGQLLVKSKDGRYETDIIILDREIQKNIFDKTLETAEKICGKLLFFAAADSNLPALIASPDISQIKMRQGDISRKYLSSEGSENAVSFSESEKPRIQKQFYNSIISWKEKYGNKTVPGALSNDLVMWFYLFKTIRDIICLTEINKNISMEYPKKYKGEWTMTGFEDYSDHELLKYNVGMDWDNNFAKQDKHLFKFYFAGFSRLKPSIDECELLADIIKNDRRPADLSDSEMGIVKRMAENGLAVIDADSINPAFPVIFTSGLNELNKYLMETDFPDELKSVMSNLIEKSEEIKKHCYSEIFRLYEYNLAQIKTGLPERLTEQAKFCARDMLHYLNNAVFKFATEKDYLKATDKPVGIGFYVV